LSTPFSAIIIGRLLGGCDTGDAKITKGYKLPAYVLFPWTTQHISSLKYISRHVIHTVGPVYHSESEDMRAKQLASCYKRSLEIAVEQKLKSIVNFHFRLLVHRIASHIIIDIGFSMYLDRNLWLP
jgi:O-acetyl-ADP-ribose deacetylase (regulator of RNase III)